ncbi:MAG: enoyl-CoA hydratase [Candidatus Tectomicrobia bacterium]|uniref:Enoyl-CoA hydratase n=1 Tax=Tectimicrobiota bacterium TaxID=2528274 RepID=A0A933GKT8_UNCTE|nr:enoyl-CoA hydratase [Candidatus Tectomicrobia bacterium]
MSTESILYRVEEKVALITLNRPEKLNALDMEIRLGLEKYLLQAEADDGVRVIVITGAGRAFCSGGDVSTMAQRLAVSATQRRKNLLFATKVPALIKQLDKPVIGAINGAAAGAGCSLALACDLRVASDKAKFGMAFVRRGLHPDWGGSYVLTRLVGTARALEMALTGDLIDAQEAFRIGLVNKVVPEASFEAGWREFAGKLAGGPPIAMAMIKSTIYKVADADFPAAMDIETFGQVVCSQTEDSKEGIAAFMEKRPANFQGK